LQRGREKQNKNTEKFMDAVVPDVRRLQINHNHAEKSAALPGGFMAAAECRIAFCRIAGLQPV
jgi:hypothetical protein